MYRALRFPENPLIHPGLSDELGHNINGPSLIRVPEWIPERLGRYYLYFAHHQGTHIRLAYADRLGGPWQIYRGGVLRLAETACRHHIASPDVQVMDDRKELVMYFHGVTAAGQRTFRAASRDGLHFVAAPVELGPFYFRVFPHAGAWFAIAKRTDAPGGGVVLRSPDGIQPFKPGPAILPRQRHVAVLKRKDVVQIFFSRGGDCPERILVAEMKLAGDWRSWRPAEPVEVLRPQAEYEGGRLPLRPSEFGAVHTPVGELRDPAIFEEAGRIYLLYTGAGESNICGAELIDDEMSNCGHH